MKLTSLLVLISLFQTHASSYGQNSKLTLHFDAASVGQVLSEIESSSEFRFLYGSDQIDLQRKVSIHVKREKISSILHLLFAATNISYRVVDRQIILTRKHPEERPNGPVKTASPETDVTQTRVSGSVTDAQGQPLPGANVVEKGSANGVQTDLDGNFTLNVSENAILVISYLGFQTQEVTVEGRTNISIRMEEGTAGLDEVVVLGYGVQKKVNLTGAVGSINFDDISNRPVTNSVNALAGAVPGLTVIQGNGQPGKDQAQIRIRGIGSINAGTAPLIIIDGITSETSDFANLSPFDIKDISVLKDAASAAIYGSRAANGVILITTKSGIEKTQINFNAYTGVQQATILPDLVNSWDYAMLSNEARINGGFSPYFSEEQIALMKNGDPSDGFSNTDWLDEVYRTAPVANYNVSVRTGSEKLKLYSSLNYYDQEGIMEYTNSNRLNLRTKFDYQVNKYLKLGLNVFGMNQNIHQPFKPLSGVVGSIMVGALRSPRAAPVYYNNGDYFVFFNDVPGLSYIPNPVKNLENGYVNVNNKNFTSAFTAEINWKGFTLNSLVSYSYDNSLTKRWDPLVRTIDDTGAEVQTNNFASLEEEFGKTDRIQVENYLNYTPDLGESHHLKGMVGQTFLQNKFSAFQGYGQDFPSNSLQVLGASSSSGQTVGGQDQAYVLNSVFGRVNYNYREKYLMEANFRVDGSSRFGNNNRYGFFPSVSAGWRISQEEFLEDIFFLSNLKLRASWGKLGNQDIGNNYAYSSGYSTNSGYLINGEFVNGAAITELANNRISWESTTSTNVGVDLGLFNKLDLSFDYYVKNTDNMLVKLPIPLTLGKLSEPYQNIGRIRNKGFELSGNFNDRINDFGYSFNFNLGYVNNKVIDINDQEFFSGRQIITEDESIFSWYGYRTSGIFQTQAEIDQAPIQNPAPVPGDIRYVDLSGIDGVPDGKIDSYDRTVIGIGFPRFTYSFGGNFNYRGFDLSLFFVGISDVDVNNASLVNQTSNADQNWTSEWLNRWTPQSPGTLYPRLAAGNTSNQLFSDYWVEDGSYLRLKNLEVGYSLPEKLCDRFHLSKIRVYAGGQNLWTITKVNNFDPERNPENSNNEFYPQIKIYQMGLNVTF